jgi:hypothetical protein
MQKSLLVAIAVCCLGGGALAQEKQHVLYKAPNGTATYVVSQNVEVGDVPGHIMRLFDTKATVKPGDMVVNGVSIVTVNSRGAGELTDGFGGTPFAYAEFVGQNGDKFYAHATLAARRVGGAPFVTWGGTLYGGTGKFAGITGFMQSTSNFDPSPGGTTNNTMFELDYAMPGAATANK